MKKILFLMLMVISFNYFSQAQSTPVKDSVKQEVKAEVPAPAQDTAVYFILGKDGDFKILEGLVANFKGLSYVEIKPILDWIASRRKVPAEPPKK